LARSTPKQTHAWLLEHDEQYRIAFFANLKTRNTKNLKKPQVETVTSGSVQESNKGVTQPVIEMFSGNDPDTTKNRNNNGHPTADGTNKSPWRTVTRRTSSGDSVSNGPFFPDSASVTSQNWNNQSTDGGTDRSVSTDTWFNQHTKEAKDMFTEATKKIESGDISATRSKDTSVQSDSSANACMQYAQRLAQRVSSLSTEELHAVMDDVTYNAPNQSVYDIMVALYSLVDEELVSWVCSLLEKRGHNTILLSVMSNCKEGYNARGSYQRYSYMFGSDAREMLFIAANIPDLATWSYHAVVNLQIAETAAAVWQKGIALLQTAYRCSPDDPFYGMATTDSGSNARSPSQSDHREGSVINMGTPVPSNTSGSSLTPDSMGNGDGTKPTATRDPPIKLKP
jgi:hypothetical protein